MNLMEQLALLARSKVGNLMSGVEFETTAQAKTAQVEKLLADADKRIARLLAEQKKTAAKSSELAQNAKASQNALSQAEEEVDAALRAGDDELARARLTRAKAMRMKAEAEESRLRANEKLVAQIEGELVTLQDQMKVVRESYSRAVSAPPAQSPVNHPPETNQPKNEEKSGPPEPAETNAAPVVDNSSLADALRQLQRKE